jgi:hypothetical protein
MEQRKNTYESLLSGAENLVERASTADESRKFESFVDELSKLRKDYIMGFRTMKGEEAEKVKYLLDSTNSYIRDRLDVIRVREMRKSVLESVRKKS